MVPAIIPVVALVSAWTWGVQAQAPAPVHLPQTPQEVSQGIERVKLPCVLFCDPKDPHFAYMTREKD